MNDPKVQYGYKYNQEPDTYQVADFTGCLNQINELYGKDLVVYVEDYNELNNIKISSSETYDNVIIRVLNEVENRGKERN